MLREEYLRRLIEGAHLELYLSGMDGARIYWPWRMLPVHEATKRYRNACEKFIVDSAFKRDDITNVDVFDRAERVGAEYAVLADVYQNKDGTVKKILEGMDTYDDHSYDGGVVAPLQAPHDSCYEDIAGQGIDMVAIGGMKDANIHQQVTAARSVRNAAGDSVHIHGLGWGLRESSGEPNQLVDCIHEEPNLLDSIDYSTPAQETTTPRHDIDKGEEMSSLQAAQIGTWMVRDLRRVSEYVDVDVESHQSGMERYNGIV